MNLIFSLLLLLSPAAEAGPGGGDVISCECKNVQGIIITEDIVGVCPPPDSPVPPCKDDDDDDDDPYSVYTLNPFGKN